MLRYGCFCFLFLLLYTVSVKAQEGALRFAPLPMENREAVYKQFESMRAYLQEVTGREVEFTFSDSYRELLNKFIAGGVDLAYLGPLPYVELRREYDKANPLVFFRETSGEAGYTCSLISLSDDVERMTGKTDLKVALTQPLSTCGYLSVNGLLLQDGVALQTKRYRYLGRHDAVALAVVRSEFDVGGVKTSIAHKYSHLGIQILKTTDTMPGFALVSNNTTISPNLARKIRQAFTALDPDGKDRQMLSRWGKKIAKGTIVASDDRYDVIRKLMGNIDIPAQDNF